jgi:hypothetical protein
VEAPWYRTKYLKTGIFPKETCSTRFPHKEGSRIEFLRKQFLSWTKHFCAVHQDVHGSEEPLRLREYVTRRSGKGGRMVKVRSFGEEEREKAVLEFTKGNYLATSEVGNVDGVSSWLLEGLADGAFWASLGLCVLALVAVVLCLVFSMPFYDLGVAFCKGSI